MCYKLFARTVLTIITIIVGMLGVYFFVKTDGVSKFTPLRRIVPNEGLSPDVFGTAKGTSMLPLLRKRRQLVVIITTAIGL